MVRAVGGRRWPGRRAAGRSVLRTLRSRTTAEVPRNLTLRTGSQPVVGLGEVGGRTSRVRRAGGPAEPSKGNSAGGVRRRRLRGVGLRGPGRPGAATVTTRLRQAGQRGEQ